MVTLYLKGCAKDWHDTFIILTWHVMNMKEVLCTFVTTVIKCHSLNYDIFNANMTLFEMSVSWQLDITKTT